MRGICAVLITLITGCGSAGPEAPQDTTPPNTRQDQRFGLFYVEKQKAALRDLGVTTTRHILLFSHLRNLGSTTQAQEIEALPSIIPRDGSWENAAVKELWKRGILSSSTHLGACGYPADMTGYTTELLQILERIDGDGVGDAPGLRFPVRAVGVLNEPNHEWLGKISSKDLAGIKTFEDLRQWQQSNMEALKKSLWEFIRITYEAIKKHKPNIKVIAYLPVITNGLPSTDKDIYLKSFDLVDLHFYGDHVAFDKKLKEHKAAAKSLGFAHRPMWTFEMGGPMKTRVFETDADFREHAEEAIKLHLVGLENGLQRIYYVSLVPLGGWSSPHFYNLSLLDEEGNRKPAYYSYKALLKRVMGFSKVTRLDPTRFHYKVEFADRPPLFVLWNNDGVQTVDLTPYHNAKSVTVTRVSTSRGTVQQREVSKSAPTNKIEIGPTPVFVN